MTVLLIEKIINKISSRHVDLICFKSSNYVFQYRISPPRHLFVAATSVKCILRTQQGTRQTTFWLGHNRNVPIIYNMDIFPCHCKRIRRNGMRKCSDCSSQIDRQTELGVKAEQKWAYLINPQVAPGNACACWRRSLSSCTVPTAWTFRETHSRHLTEA